MPSRVGSVVHFLHWQFTDLPYPSTSWEGKTVIITGGNGGLGLETAKHFYRLGAEKVIITARDARKGEAAKAEMETTVPGHGIIEVWNLDLNSFDSIRAFVGRMNTLDRVDALIENAGMMSRGEFSTVQGDEKHIAVNVISTFLIAFMVLPKLRQIARAHGIRPHLVVVSSDLHNWASFKERKHATDRGLLDVLNDPTLYNPTDRYMVSKLLEVWICREMAQRRPDDLVVLIFTNPGYCHSDLARELDTVGARLSKKVMARPGEVGSRNFVWAASAGPEAHGQYFSNCQIAAVGGLAAADECNKEGPELQRRIFSEVCGRLEEIEPGVTSNLYS